MKYLSSEPFSVGGNPSKAYEDGWDAIFKPKPITDWDKHIADCNAAADAALTAEPPRDTGEQSPAWLQRRNRESNAYERLAELSFSHLIHIRTFPTGYTEREYEIEVESTDGRINTYYAKSLDGAITIAYQGSQ